MTDSEQNQQVEGHSLAIQSGRDTTINQGISTEQMQAIVREIAAQIPHFAAIAKEIVNARLENFEEKILQKFSDKNSTSMNAFSDPDFQYLVGKANHEYARSGDELICDNLINLIARRSLESKRSRLSLSLNEAVEKSALLTHNEFAELSFVFVIRHTSCNIRNRDEFARYLNQHLVPLLDDISFEISSYTYLEAQSCAKLEAFSIELMRYFVINFAGVLSKGFNRDDLYRSLPEKEGCIDDMLIPCLADPTKIQVNSLNKTEFEKQCANKDLNPSEIENLYTVVEKNLFSENELIASYSDSVPRIADLFSIWKASPLHKMALTSVGIALAYSNLTRFGPMSDISIWIK